MVAPQDIPGLSVRARVPYDQLGGLTVAMPDSEQLQLAQKNGLSYQQLVASESLPELEKWREFLISKHD